MTDPTTELAAQLTQGAGWTPTPPPTNLLVGDPTGANVFIDDALTQPLTDYYTSGPGGTGVTLAQAMFQFSAASGDYTYYVWGSLLDGSDTLPFFASGGVNTYGAGLANVREYYRAYGPDEITKAVTFAFGAVDGSDNGVPYTAFYTLIFGQMGVTYQGTNVLHVGAAVDYDANTPVTFGGVSAGRGLVSRNTLLTDSATFGTGAFTAISTAPPSGGLWQVGHAYEVRYGECLKAVTGTPRVQTWISGGTVSTSVLYDAGYTQPLSDTATPYLQPAAPIRFIVNTAGMTSFIFLRHHCDAGSALSARLAVPSLRWLEVWDIGSSADYPDLTPMV